MFIADFMLLFSIMVHFAFLFPSLRLPSYDFDLFGNLSMPIPQFFLDFAMCVINIFKIFKVPEWDLSCSSFDLLASSFNLCLATFTVSVVISSDIITVVYDRQNRINALEPKSEDSDFEKLPKKLEFARGLLKTIRTQLLKTRARVVKSVVAISQQVVWYAVTLTTNSVSLYIVVSLQRFVDPKGGTERTSVSPDWSAENGECTVGVQAVSSAMTICIACCLLSYVVRVLTGMVYKDGIWVLTAAIVQEERLFSCGSLHRFKALLKLAIGSFLFPGAALGMTQENMEFVLEKFFEREEVKLPSEPEPSFFYCRDCMSVCTAEDKDYGKIKHRKKCPRAAGSMGQACAEVNEVEGEKGLNEWKFLPRQYPCKKCIPRYHLVKTDETTCGDCQGTSVLAEYVFKKAGLDLFVSMTDPDYGAMSQQEILTGMAEKRRETIRERKSVVK